jgi:hypothetical protein
MRERVRERQRVCEKEKETEECVYVFVCVCEKEKETEECVYVCEFLKT